MSYCTSGFRPVGSGAAWRRSPHQKSAGREIKGREGMKERKEEKEKRREKGKKGRGQQERCIMPMGVKQTLRTVKRFI